MGTEPALTWQPEWAVPPGELLQEALEERRMTQAELARRTGRPLKTINEIVKGKSAITPETAIQLEIVLGISASFWLNLERRYREHEARSQEKERLEREGSWADRFPIAAMITHRLVPKTRSKADHMLELLKFFAVSSPPAWERQWASAEAAFRQSPAFTASPEAVSVWLRWGELQAESIRCRPYDPAQLEKALPAIRKLTRLDPLAFVPELQTILARCGVALVLTPELPGTHLSGAARWLSPDKALVQLSLRHRTDDQFWFALFHELHHVLRGGRRRAFLDTPERPRRLSQEEADADRFAADQLIPTDEYRRIAELPDLKPDRLRQTAQQLGISAGIVVGRLQRDKRLEPSQLNYLKRSLHWSQEVFTPLHRPSMGRL
jgi:HTH-type transcriptional regulator / antitoxin HigA